MFNGVLANFYDKKSIYMEEWWHEGALGDTVNTICSNPTLVGFV